MKRPLLFLFFLTALGISCLYPRQYQADPIFPQGSYYTVTVHGQLQTYHHQTTTLSLTLTDCRIDYGEKTYQCPQLLVTVDEETKLYTSNQAVRDTAAFLPEDPPYHVRSSLRAGNLLAVEGSLSSFQPARNPGNFDWYSYYRARHLSYRLYADAITVTDPQCTLLRQTLLDLRSDLTNCLQRLCSDDPSTAALLTALLLGDKTALEEDTKAAYEDGGILHILTVSGLHISLLGTAALTLGKKCHLPPWLRNLLSGLLVLLYWQLCGAGMSAGRATIMFLCLTAAPLLGRTYDSLSALSLAGLLILWDSPTMLFQAGFQLSFGAVLGIQLVCPAFASTVVAIPDASAPPSLGKKLCDSLRFGLGLQLTLLPITLYHFFRYPLYSIFLNLLVLPLTTPLFLLGAGGLLMASILPLWGTSFASWILLPCRWILTFYDLLCESVLHLPGASTLLGRPQPLRIGLYYAALVLFCLWRSRHSGTRWILPLFVTVFLSLLLLPLPTTALSVVFLDVGQGDCAFLETPAGTTILIDGGSSDIKDMATYRLGPFLESRGVRHLDYIFFSHTDEDHVNGVMNWLDAGGSIGTAILPALSDPLASEDSYQNTLAHLSDHQVPILTFSQGMEWQEGDLTLTCLAPTTPEDAAALRYTDLNTASLVLLAEYQGIRILFTGDCEEEGEDILLSQLIQEDLTCHILKAGHHGSAYATGDDFLAQLRPQSVIVSCGVRNRYGHPHPSMLTRVKAAGSSCFVTAGCGAILVTVRDGQARLHTMLPAGPLYYRR